MVGGQQRGRIQWILWSDGDHNLGRLGQEAILDLPGNFSTGDNLTLIEGDPPNRDSMNRLPGLGGADLALLHCGAHGSQQQGDRETKRQRRDEEMGNWWGGMMCAAGNKRLIE